MQNKNKILTGALSLVFVLASASSVWALSKTFSPSQSEAKKCEKCERGADGKMTCKPVPCP